MTKSVRTKSTIVLCERRYLAQDQPADFLHALHRRGASASLLTDEYLDEAPTMDAGLVVARGRSPALLATLTKFEASGVRTVNAADAIAAVVNKWHMAQALRAHGVPGPRTWLSPATELHDRVQTFPIVIKPVFGDNGRDIRLLRDRTQLDQLQWTEPFALLQEFIEGEPLDLKLYGINGAVWAVRKPSPLVDCADAAPDAPAQMLQPSSPLYRLARRCAEIFGLALYGVDCMLGPHGPQVIEINDFPNYTRVANAGDRIAEFVLDTLH